MDTLKIVKLAVRIVVGAGTGSIVNQIIKNNVEVETVIQHVTVPAASFAIGSMVSDLTKDYTDTKIDEMATSLRKLFKKKEIQVIEVIES